MQITGQIFAFNRVAVADPGLSEGGFVLGKDIETPKSLTEIGCRGEVSPPLPIEVRSVEELFPSRKFLKKNPWEYYILLYFHALVNNF